MAQQAKLFAGRRLKNTFNPYFLPLSFASVKQGCFGKQQLWAAFAGGAFCGCAHRFSSGASSPAFRFPSQPALLSPPGAAGLAELSLGFLCLISRSPWLQMNCMKPALLLIPFPSSAEPAGAAGGGAWGRGCWLSGRPVFGEAGAGCAQRRLLRRLRDPQEELTAGTRVSLEIWWKSLHDLDILSPIFSVR